MIRTVSSLTVGASVVVVIELVVVAVVVIGGMWWLVTAGRGVCSGNDHRITLGCISIGSGMVVMGMDHACRPHHFQYHGIKFIAFALQQSVIEPRGLVNNPGSPQMFGNSPNSVAIGGSRYLF